VLLVLLSWLQISTSVQVAVNKRMLQCQMQLLAIQNGHV
jgi:hypothetical protein